MNVFINALASTNLSGRQVLCGHVEQLLRQTADTHHYTLLHHAGNADILDRIKSAWGAAEWPTSRWASHCAPAWTSHWAGRAMYERLFLPHLIRKLAANCYLSLSGGWTPGISCPQYTLALNPWALLDVGEHAATQKAKAALQRKFYIRAVKYCAGIGYGSAFMRQAYRTVAGIDERRSEIVYPALESQEISDLDALVQQDIPREPFSLLCVSLMGPHKNIESLLEVLYRVRKKGVPATLRLVGGWPDAEYKRRIINQISALGLIDAVKVDGHVSRAVLRRAYCTAQVYVLLSRSESFGIPSVEAQRVGTPVLAASECAAPEICGKGGVYFPATDHDSAAEALCRLLTDRSEWTCLSRAARENALRFEYAKTTPALISLMKLDQSSSAAQIA